jgi:hypothetical protein
MNWNRIKCAVFGHEWQYLPAKPGYMSGRFGGARKCQRCGIEWEGVKYPPMPPRPWSHGNKPDGLEVRIAKLRLEPGDTLVITTNRFLTMEQRKQITATLVSALPGMKALVLDGGLQLSVISQQAGGRVESSPPESADTA